MLRVFPFRLIRSASVTKPFTWRRPFTTEKKSLWDEIPTRLPEIKQPKASRVLGGAEYRIEDYDEEQSKANRIKWHKRHLQKKAKRQKMAEHERNQSRKLIFNTINQSASKAIRDAEILEFVNKRRDVLASLPNEPLPSDGNLENITKKSKKSIKNGP